MSRKLDQGIISEITERLMQPEAYEGVDGQFVLVAEAVNEEGDEDVFINLNYGSIFLTNAIGGLIDTLGDKKPELLPLLMDKIAEEITEKKSAH